MRLVSGTVKTTPRSYIHLKVKVTFGYILVYSQYIASFTDTSVHFTVTCSVNILYTWIGFVHTVLKSDLVSKFKLKVILQMIRLQFSLKPFSQTMAKLVFYANVFL